MATTYTLATARALLPEARERVAAVAATVADLQRLAREAAGPEPPPGAVPAVKAAEAAADDQLGWFRERGIQVKSIAPALLDFPARATRAGEEIDVLLCWREGEDELDHYHPLDTGYLGREPVSTLDRV